MHFAEMCCLYRDTGNAAREGAPNENFNSVEYKLYEVVYYTAG